MPTTMLLPAGGTSQYPEADESERQRSASQCHDKLITGHSPIFRKGHNMTIAVAHSETDRGKAALRTAVAEARLHGEPLAVLRITPGVDEPSTEDSALAEQLAAELAEFSDVTWKLHMAPEKFDTADALLDLAEQVGASLLVIGSRRRRPIGKVLLGSTVQDVLLKSQIPVLVVKAF
jgi:nucleotide-binding universal stress UspA family protein